MDRVTFAVIFSIALAFLIPNVILSSVAAPYTTDMHTVSIQLSQTCTTMHKNNVTTTCPTYETLVGLGWDTSLPGTGEFYYDENGYYQRGDALYHDVHELYRYDDYHVIIDPPTEISTRSKLIVISPSLPVYVPLGGYDKVDHSRELARDRYVERCNTATITSENWEFLISDTIYYLRNGCNHTNFSSDFVEHDYISSMDRTTSQKYKHDTWLEKVKKECKEKC
jgi:hypothetical protein